MPNRSAATTWTLAIITSALGATLLFSAEAGVNWPIWIAAASISVLAARLSYRGRIEAPLVILLGWATLLSLHFAFRAAGFVNLLVVLSDAMLLGLAIVSMGSESWRSLSARLLAVVPFVAPFRVWRATITEVADTPRSVSSPRSRSLVRGALLSAPLVILLIVLLGSADPVIQWATDHIAAWIPDWSFPQRVLFFLFLLSLTLGANSIAARQADPVLPAFPKISRRLTIGITEQRMVLLSTAVILWLFVALQLSYFVHPPPVALNSGITFAEYARRGFSELSVVATIVGAIILVLEYTRPLNNTDKERKNLIRLELALVIALELILLSAFRRVILYEQAYGFTTARLVAQAYMVVMSLALVALALEVKRGSISVNFARRVFEIALGVLTIFALWNHEAWIVNRNIDRGVATGKFDLSYASRLSADAIPTLISRRAELGPGVANAVVGAIRCDRNGANERRWFEWNQSANNLRQALRSLHPEPCPAGQGLYWFATPTDSVRAPVLAAPPDKSAS